VDPVHGGARLISGTIYTEPETGCEILLLGDDIPFGAAYHPRRAGDAVPWHSGCEHCNRSRQTNLNIDLKRALLTLTTRRASGLREQVPVHGYTILSSATPYTVWHWILDNDHHADVDCPSGQHLHASLPEDRPLKIEGDGKRRSVWLRKGLRLLFSARPATPNEISAVASFFAPSLEDLRKGRRNICLKIDWSEILANTSPPKMTIT
jgi:hypothetical protein